MARVAVKPELICWALDRAGLTADDLREKFPKLDDWTAEKVQPTLRQLEGFARATVSFPVKRTVHTETDRPM